MIDNSMYMHVLCVYIYICVYNIQFYVLLVFGSRMLEARSQAKKAQMQHAWFGERAGCSLKVE